MSSEFNGVYVNPYDTNTQDFQPETKPIDEIMRMGIANALMKVRVMLPGSIVEVLGNQKATIQPVLQSRYTNGDVINLPPLQNVMVMMPMGADYSIKLPIAVGDTGTLIFCDRSLDVWSASDGEVVDPQDSRIHDLSDPIFIPGLVPFSMQTDDDTTDMVFTNGDAVLRIQKDGTLVFTNGENELMDLLVQITGQVHMLADTLSTDTVNTAIGPMQLNAFTTYAQIASTVDSLKSMLETLKGSL